jgi:hypothetical protein
MPISPIANLLNSDVAFLWLLTFKSYDGTPALRAVNNLEDVISREHVYTAFPFELTLPPDDGQKPTQLSLTFPNVGRELMALVRRYSPERAPQITMELVLSSDPDVVEKKIDFLRVTSAEYDAMAITFTLNSTNIFGRKTCSAIYNQAEFPGMFFSMR